MDGLLDLVRAVAGAAAIQHISNSGFEAGKNGEPPRVIFFSSIAQEMYEESYQKGQQAAAAGMMTAVAKKLDRL